MKTSPARPLGLQHREPVLERHVLDRGRHQRGAGAALRPVRLGHHAEHLDVLGQQSAERRHRERRGAEEDDAHELSARSTSGLTGLDDVLAACPSLAGQEQLPLERAQVIEEEDAVEVVDLVLDGAGDQALGLERNGLPSRSSASSTIRSGRVTSP